MDRSKKRGKRRNMYESLTIKQAQHKNFALDAHLSLVHKIISGEKRIRKDEIDKARKVVAQTLERTRDVFPVTGNDLQAFHVERRGHFQDVCLHIVNCYLRRQDKNKAHWLRMREHQMLPCSRPVTTPDHLLFIHEAFPETYYMKVDADEESVYYPNADIYEHPRAGHDMKCLSTRSKPVGANAYPPQRPVNIRHLRPHPEESDAEFDETSSSKAGFSFTQGRRLPSITEGSAAADIVAVPDLGLVDVSKDGVYVLDKGKEPERTGEDRPQYEMKKLETHIKHT